MFIWLFQALKLLILDTLRLFKIPKHFRSKKSSAVWTRSLSWWSSSSSSSSSCCSETPQFLWRPQTSPRPPAVRGGKQWGQKTPCPPPVHVSSEAETRNLEDPFLYWAGPEGSDVQTAPLWSTRVPGEISRTRQRMVLHSSRTILSAKSF